MQTELRGGLDSLFKAKSVAVVGASNEQGSRGQAFMDKLLRFGYKGEIYPVNPKHESVAGMRCYNSLASIPGEVEFAAIAVPSILVPDILKGCADAGVRAGIVVASGFGEATDDVEGNRLQERVVEICETNRIALCGPNCIGIAYLPNDFVAFSTSMPPSIKKGKVALILQSGMITITVVQRLHQRDIGLSHIVTPGNEAVLNAADYLSYFVEEQSVAVIGLFVEGVREPEKFLGACERARQLRKPIVLLKAGKSREGARAALTHTGSVVGSNDVFEGAMRQRAVVLVDSLDELIEHLSLFSNPDFRRARAGKGVAFVSLSGGVASLVGDVSQQYGLRLAQPGRATQAALRKWLPAHSAISNPLDAGSREKANAVPECLSILSRDESVGAVVHLTNTLTKGGDYTRSYEMAGRIASYGNRLKKPLAILSLASGNVDREGPAPGKRYAVLQGLAPGIKALSSMSWYLEKSTRKKPASKVLRGDGPAVQGSPKLSDSLRLLERYGIPVAGWRLARDRAELLRSAKELRYPVALKADTAAHKSDLGLVRLDIPDEGRLIREHEALGRRSAALSLDGTFIVQRMVKGGIEIALGSRTDETFGPALMVGLGGIFVETLKDYSIRLPPIDGLEASDMLDELKCRRLLEGARGRTPVDLPRLTDIMVRFSHLILDNSGQIREFDINPLVAVKDSVIAVDARAVANDDATS